jgi:hypothetical protein
VKIKNCGNPDVINNPNANDLNIDNLKDNQSVTKVKIIGNPTLRNINILQDCPNLVELYVIEAYLESLKLEKNNSKLEKLIIKNCNELIQLDLLNGKWLFDLRLQSLTKLKNLNINNCQKIHKLIVKGCGKLGSINLDNNSDLTFIGLLGIGTIESFKIKNCKRLVALEIRQNSPVNVGNNVAIDLGDCVALTSVYSDLKNVTFINMPQSVEGLETSYLVLPNLKSLNQCKKLMGLWLRYSIIDNILEGFEGLPELVFLNLVGSNVKADTKLISNLIKLCPKLKTICFECGQISEKEAKLAEKQHPGIKIIRWK